MKNMNETMYSPISSNCSSSGCRLRSFDVPLQRGVVISAIVLVAVANCSIVLSILRKKSLRRLRNMPLLSLAIADLFVGVLLGPLFVLTSGLPSTANPCILYGVAEVFCFTASLLNMLVVSIERWVAIFKPLKYTRFITPLSVWGLIGFAWCLSLIMAVAKACFSRGESYISCGYEWPRTGNFPIVFCTIFIVLSIIMGVMQVKIYKVVCFHFRRTAPLMADSCTEGETTGNEYATLQAHNLQTIKEPDVTRTKEDSIAIVMSQERRIVFVKETKCEEDPTNMKATQHSDYNENKSTETQHTSRVEKTSLEQTTRRFSSLPLEAGLTHPREYQLSSSPLELQTLNRAKRKKSRILTATVKLQHKTAQAVSLLYLIFIVMWSPFILMVLITYNGFCEKYAIAGFAAARILIFFNSLVNPLIFAVRIKEFRKALKEVICCGKLSYRS